MKIFYAVLAVIALLELIGIRASLQMISAAYVIWMKTLEQEVNPLVTVEPGEKEDKFSVEQPKS
jgi:hypothetical protein